MRLCGGFLTAEHTSWMHVRHRGGALAPLDFEILLIRFSRKKWCFCFISELVKWNFITVAPLRKTFLVPSLQNSFRRPCLTDALIIQPTLDIWSVAILMGGLGGLCHPRFLLGPPSFFLNFKIFWLTYAGLPNALNTGHFINSARSKLCRNS